MDKNNNKNENQDEKFIETLINSMELEKATKPKLLLLNFYNLEQELINNKDFDKNTIKNIIPIKLNQKFWTIEVSTETYESFKKEVDTFVDKELKSKEIAKLFFNKQEINNTNGRITNNN